MNYIGIDPGISGGIAVLYGDRVQATLKLKDATERDVWNFVRDHRGLRSQAIIEKVAATPQMGTVSSFTFGRSCGFLRGMLTAMEIRFDDVTPQTWQKFMRCLTKGDKNVSKAKAQQLFPAMTITHAIADALLLAEYLRRTTENIQP